MNKEVLISVIMPVYNAEAYLDEAIQSILKQTYNNFEFIIINDGSTDKSLELIKEYEKEDERIILISRENRGLVASLNEGIQKSNGKYIARMDADDISLPERFERQIIHMKSQDLDICGGNFLSINSQGFLMSLHLTPQSNDLCVLSMVSKVPFAHPTVMIKKKFLNKHNLKYGQSKYKRAEDFDLWIRMYNNGAKFGNTNDIILKYRILSNSLSKRNDNSIKLETREMIKKFYIDNKERIINILSKDNLNLNTEEESLLIRAIYKIYLKKFKLKVLKHLKVFNKRNLICTILSEVQNG